MHEVHVESETWSDVNAQSGAGVWTSSTTVDKDVAPLTSFVMHSTGVQCSGSEYVGTSQGYLGLVTSFFLLTQPRLLSWHMYLARARLRLSI